MRSCQREAADTLELIARRHGGRDALNELLENAPIDDEPTTPEEEAAVQIARDELARGETISLDEIRRGRQWTEVDDEDDGLLCAEEQARATRV